jgi:hypothetical protein
MKRSPPYSRLRIHVNFGLLDQDLYNLKFSLICRKMQRSPLVKALGINVSSEVTLGSIFIKKHFNFIDNAVFSSKKKILVIPSLLFPPVLYSSCVLSCANYRGVLCTLQRYKIL